MDALKTPTKRRDDTQWFILGVAIGFAGSVVDNLYWGLAWTAYYIDSAWADLLFSSGIYFNLFDRQLAGIFAAYCHVKAAIKNGQIAQRGRLNRCLLLAGLFGFAYTITLSVIRGANFAALFGVE